LADLADWPTAKSAKLVIGRGQFPNHVLAANFGHWPLADRPNRPNGQKILWPRPNANPGIVYI